MGEGNTDGIFEGYKKNEDISLSSYGVLAGVFNAIFALFLLVSRGTGRSLPERVDVRDIALLGMATHKLSLIGAEDAVTSPLRAPFTELQEKESPKKVDEEPRGEGLRRSVGELLTCKFCLGVWLASFFTYARAPHHPPGCHDLRRRHRLGLPPPDVQGPHEPGVDLPVTAPR